MTNQSGNCCRWFTLLTHTGVKENLLDRIPQGEKTTLVSSFAVSVLRNQFGTTNKSKLLHKTVKPQYQMYLHPSVRLFIETLPYMHWYRNPLSYSNKYGDRNKWTPNQTLEVHTGQSSAPRPI